ncbi:hypothetical protein BDW42DRAFT_127576 [Aspergillus taichungensis]|uniref:Uncharacterized protein n=1 Tax=Aspergillus taichungensis TaxID=482145 RepID=A0A2J5HQA3_9EURO|nr:hypothetical protein BDW42DRAFT_127576 [Aspergillus taichungensis]
MALFESLLFSLTRPSLSTVVGGYRNAVISVEISMCAVTDSPLHIHFICGVSRLRGKGGISLDSIRPRSLILLDPSLYRIFRRKRSTYSRSFRLYSIRRDTGYEFPIDNYYTK